MVIDLSSFFAAALPGGWPAAGNEKMYSFQPYCKLIVPMSGITDNDE
ncbi:hypothetical protein [Rhizobium sp. 1399]|nr:hypothetical protein [Rhizobium sp. 1399]MDR6663933.1 hypothetical protein [Rhizobium sp. 1399]